MCEEFVVAQCARGGRDQNQPRFLGMKTATFFECVVQLLGNV